MTIIIEKGDCCN